MMSLLLSVVLIRTMNKVQILTLKFKGLVNLTLTSPPPSTRCVYSAFHRAALACIYAMNIYCRPTISQALGTAMKKQERCLLLWSLQLHRKVIINKLHTALCFHCRFPLSTMPFLAILWLSESQLTICLSAFPDISLLHSLNPPVIHSARIYCVPTSFSPCPASGSCEDSERIIIVTFVASFFFLLDQYVCEYIKLEQPFLIARSTSTVDAQLLFKCNLIPCM